MSVSWESASKPLTQSVLPLLLSFLHVPSNPLSLSPHLISPKIPYSIGFFPSSLLTSPLLPAPFRSSLLSPSSRLSFSLVNITLFSVSVISLLSSARCQFYLSQELSPHFPKPNILQQSARTFYRKRLNVIFSVEIERWKYLLRYMLIVNRFNATRQPNYSISWSSIWLLYYSQFFL